MPTPFEPYRLGRITLTNRIVMAPMTRSRAYGPGATPTDLMATYYAQRSSAGLIVTEGTQPSVVGQGYPDTPGLHSAEQVQAWRRVTDAVHARGGHIFAQLMHAGRVGDPALLPDGMLPVGPSAVAAQGQIYTHAGPKPFSVPEALDEAGIAQTIADFADAAANAIDAGFDGVELHGANGYLIQQFLSSNANLRTDRWGGSPENRARLGVEIARAVVARVGADRVGFRISPGNTVQDIAETEIEATYTGLVRQLDELSLAYLHILEVPGQRDLARELRGMWHTTLILNPDTRPNPTGPEALALIEDGAADLIAYGSLFLANPDLPARLAAGGPFNTPDRSTSFGGDEHGYTDYPTLDELAGQPEQVA
ncbi:MAG TPA: alkene reductase [Propionibacteriaceae bacterium]|nr:alkene reductase [Propionibacteriaceae bacterium]